MERLDEGEIYKWFDVFKGGNQLTEIRIVDNSGKNGSGYFTDASKIIESLKPYCNDYNIYFTVNQVNPECYGRIQRDKIVLKPKNATTDNEIVARDWVYIDFDAKRVSGSNATEEQVKYAKDKANEVYKFLRDNGFYEPIVIFSGNGVHFYLRCALANTEDNNKIIKKFIQVIGLMFTDANVDIDQKVFNIGRISRVPGTYSCKGSKQDLERPQRMCRFVKCPENIQINDLSYFKKIADLYPDEDNKPSYDNNYSTGKFDLEEFIRKHNIPVTGKKEVSDGTRYYLEHCLFDPNHKGKDAILFSIECLQRRKSEFAEFFDSYIRILKYAVSEHTRRYNDAIEQLRQEARKRREEEELTRRFANYQGKYVVN